MSGTEVAAAIEAHMRDYIACWNAKDTLGLATRYYRLAPSNPLSTETGLRAFLDEIVAQGFDRVALDSLEARALGPDEGKAHVRYTRFTAKGESLPSSYRGVVYDLRRFPDGWRIVDMRSVT